MFLLTLGFTEAKSDTSLFIYRRGDETAYLLLYVDDIVLTASSQQLLQSVISSLQQEFAMKDLVSSTTSWASLLSLARLASSFTSGSMPSIFWRGWDD